MGISRPGDLNKLITICEGDRDLIAAELTREITADPELVLRVERVQPFLTVEQVRHAISTVFDGGHPEKYLGYIDHAQNFFPDEELRERIALVHQSHPWAFYIHAESLHRLFPNEYFKRLMDQGTDFTRDANLLKIFQLYNAEAPLVSFNDETREKLLLLLDTQVAADIFLESPKEPGFACGGMEKNFLQAVTRGEGACLVNDLLLAKLYHTKGADKAKKVSYVARRTQTTEEGYLLWKDYIYAPTANQHVPMTEAIQSGARELQISGLTVKPVRPLIGLTSDELFRTFESHAGTTEATE